MNEKTRAQIEAMKNQTIGVEVEMNNITRQKAATKVAEFFGTTAYYAAAQYGYMTWACKDQQGRVWKFQRDVSISGPDDEKCELVTPILTYDDIETLQSILRLLRKAGAKSSPSRGCGVHIHIGKGNHTAKTLRNLVNIMASHEEQIGRAIRIDSSRTSHYCRSVEPAFLELLTAGSPPRWTSSETSGTRATARTTAETSTTIPAGTTCSTSTRPSPRARLNSGFSNSQTPTTESAAGCMPER